MDSDHDPSSSPSPSKRQRMSSPFYDEQMDFPSQQEIDAADELELKLSQKPEISGSGPDFERPNFGTPFYGLSYADRSSQDYNNRDAIDFPEKSTTTTYPAFTTASSVLPAFPQKSFHDEENPFTTSSPKPLGFASALSAHVRKKRRSSSIDGPLSTEGSSDTSYSEGKKSAAPLMAMGPAIGFTSAAKLAIPTPSSSQIRSRSSSPDGDSHQERDFSDWFQPGPIPGPVGFTTALPLVKSADLPALAFTTAKEKSLHWLAPSEAALKAAEEKMKLWEVEERFLGEPLEENLSQAISEPGPSRKDASVTSPPRKALSAVENSFTPARMPLNLGASGFSTPSSAGNRATVKPPSAFGSGGVQPFRSPMMRAPAMQPLRTPAVSNSPLNPRRSALSQPGLTSTPARGFRPLVAATSASSALETPLRQAAFSTPPRALGVTPLRLGTGQKKFVTPFKTGMRPGEPGRTQLEAGARRQRAAVHTPGVANKVAVGPVRTSKKTYFDMTAPHDRKSLASSGLWPEPRYAGRLHGSDINMDELKNITTETAIHYSFHPPPPQSDPSSSKVSSSSQGVLGPATALKALTDLGCSLATKEWVDNHWCLILWKLAGMVCLDPQRESDTDEKRWCWAEVIRQLRYRYEKELNGGSRPALRLITTQDAPAGSHMVLCISNIFWSAAGIDADGLATIPHPTLEVTDGWYRLRAEVDEPLARAARKGALRVGRKIAVAGAKLSRESEPCEVLEAYESCQLTLTGNGSHLAPWHAKLGFQAHPAIATLHSLTPDGGIVNQLDLVVQKMYPIAFFEFFEKNGEKLRDGPRKEDEEMKIHDQWMRRREREESKLRSEIRGKHNIYDEWADKLQRKAVKNGIVFRPEEDDVPPANLEEQFDGLCNGDKFEQLLFRLKWDEAGWLARYINERIEKEQETMNEDIERYLKDLVPPRDVRSFRILLLKDAVTSRRPANRIVELTVWNVLNLSFDEGHKPGYFKEGQRFRITNLIPSQKSAWMDASVDSHIYLSTSRGTRWTKV
ncbi:hypothetical protein BV25DRAFT_1901580 [Artomyces pyxidatus]|uniref:Uncharacterized protein n=1 Tax=Artomyces pyxidatus TaxID=48021 RepID=A0ACB8SSU4_9AGAM|nr:hypothetical protein BV25DRAFT_1901580 [Artomyces pyxidatus]